MSTQVGSTDNGISPATGPLNYSNNAAVGKLRAAAISWLLLLPAIIFLIACFAIPLCMLLSISFEGEGGAFSAYATLLSDEVFLTVFYNTTKLATVVTAISVLLAYPAALLLSKLRGAALSVALYCVLVPFWISVLVRAFSWMLLLERNGPVNGTILFLGIAEKPLKLLFNDFSVYLGMVHVLLPYAILPIYSSILKVDRRILRASDGLGASQLQTFCNVYLPLTLNGVLTGALFVFLMSLGFYVTPSLLGGLSNLTVAMLIDNFVNERLVWPLAAAASFILLGIILAILTLASRFVALKQVVAVR
jgi:putative spermidine/putrescine transport system permease protein